ncbi:MAG: cupin domain-containing protein [Rhizobiales bacterium]|nr:cupin domain-containing protein [Hyphomicrobiales bacterium]
MNHIRIYTDQDGESHFEEIETEFKMEIYAPPAPEFGISEPTSAARYVMVRFPPNWDSELHPSPRRQLFIMLSGMLQSRTSGGKVIDLEPGDVALMEDTTGKGHTAKAMNGKEVRAIMVHLD